MERLPAKNRKQVGNAIHSLLKANYFPTIPLDEIRATLAYHNIVLLQEDNTEWSGFLLGRNEHVLFRLGHVSSVQEMNGLKFYEPLANVGFSLSWYKDDSRKNIEVVGYVC